MVKLGAQLLCWAPTFATIASRFILAKCFCYEWIGGNRKRSVTKLAAATVLAAYQPFQKSIIPSGTIK